MTAANESEWHSIGQHLVRIELPDIVHVRLRGDVTRSQIEGILAFERDVPRPEKGFFSLMDVFDAGRPNLEILRSADIVKQIQQYRAMVYYRAQFKHRTVLEIVQKINRTLNLSLSLVPLVAFATETQARAWIAEQRQAHD